MLSGSIKARYLKYWTIFYDLAKSESLPFTIGEPTTNGLFYCGNLHRKGMKLEASCKMSNGKERGKSIGVKMVMFGDARSDFDKLMGQKEHLASALGGSLTWREDVMGSVLLLHPTFDPTIQSQWPDQHRWLIDTLQHFHQTIAPIVALRS